MYCPTANKKIQLADFSKKLTNLGLNYDYILGEGLNKV